MIFSTMNGCARQSFIEARLEGSRAVHLNNYYNNYIKITSKNYQLVYITLRRVFILNECELLTLPHYRIIQTIAQSIRLDEQTSGKPEKIFQKKILRFLSAIMLFSRRLRLPDTGR